MSHWLTGVDPSWFSGVPEPLHTALLASPRGRRLLLARPGFAPVLQHPGTAADLLRRFSAEARDRLIVELGALALSPAIRSVVQRDLVRQLKEVLGEAHALALSPFALLHRPGADSVRAQQVQLREAMAQADGLRALVQLQGRIELFAHGRLHDPALAEWLCLCASRDTPWDSLPALLPDEMRLAHCGSGGRTGDLP